uniref:ATP synthase subunit 8 n=1 Tax=Porcellionides pruinosus TaxID=96870 RepID=A0A1P8DKI1_PORPN|nr:ATP synthase subunit 8 [Porcellionides pruinosus]
MPQMGPLPWIGVWMATLMVALLLVMLVYFIPKVMDSKSGPVSKKLPYMWGW